MDNLRKILMLLLAFGMVPTLTACDDEETSDGGVDAAGPADAEVDAAPEITCEEACASAGECLASQCNQLDLEAEFVAECESICEAGAEEAAGLAAECGAALVTQLRQFTSIDNACDGGLPTLEAPAGVACGDDLPGFCNNETKIGCGDHDGTLERGHCEGNTDIVCCTGYTCQANDGQSGT